MSEESPDQEGMDEGLADEWAEAMEEAGETGGDVEDEWAAAMSEQDVKPVELEELSASGDKDVVPKGMDMIMDIPVTLSMELGSTSIAIRNLLQLTQGSVVELDRYAGEPLDVLVNGTLIAHGEVVVVNDKYGIRLTDVVSPTERMKRIR